MKSESQAPLAGKGKYDDYYSDGTPEKWRTLSASAKVDNITNLCSRVPHDKILEVGCGNGVVLEELDRRQFGVSLFGLEISESAMTQLSNKDIPSLVEAKLFDGSRLPFKDHEFDIVVLSHVVEHLEHPRILLKEAARVANHVFVEVPLEHTIRLAEDFDFNAVGHINFYTATTIRRLLQTSGLIIEDQIVTDTSREVLVFQKGFTGLLQHWIRRASLMVFPKTAQRIFVYHSALLAKSEVA